MTPEALKPSSAAPALKDEKEPNYDDFTISKTMTPNGAFVDTRVVARCFKNGEVNLISTTFGCGFGEGSTDNLVRLDNEAIDKLLTLIWNDPAREKTNAELREKIAALEASAPPAAERTALKEAKEHASWIEAFTDGEGKLRPAVRREVFLRARRIKFLLSEIDASEGTKSE